MTLLFVVAFLSTPVFGATISITGTVNALDGTVVEGASVWLAQQDQIRRTQTDVEGRFRFENADVGEAQVVAYKEGFALGGRSDFAWEEVELALELPPAGLLSLRLLNREHQPLPGGRIQSMRISDKFTVPVEELVEEGFPPLRSGDDGILAIPLLPKGGFLQFIVTHLDHADVYVPYLPEGRENHDVMLHPGVELRGRVTHTGQGVGGASVSVFRKALGGRTEYAHVTADPEGFYAARVPPGTYYVDLRHPDYATPAPPQAILEAESGEPAVLDLELAEKRTIEGSLLFPDGSPCPGAPFLHRVQGFVVSEGYTGQDGNFSITVSGKPGVLNVTPPPGFLPDFVQDIHVDMGEKKHLRLPPLSLKELPTIRGTIRDDKGEPVAGAFLSSRNLSRPVWAIAGEDGAFEIRLNYTPKESEVQLRVEHPLRFLRRDFKANLNKPKALKVKMKKYEPDSTPPPPERGWNHLEPLMGKPAPSIECDTWFNTQPLALDALRGKVVVLTFWGGFDESPYGKNRIEELRALHDLLRGVEDVIFLAVHDGTSDPGDVETYVHRFGITFPAGRDAEPFKTFVGYGINFIPQTVLIDKEGVFRFYQVEGRLLELIKLLRRRG